MNYRIENDILKVEISDKGAELQSIILKSDNCEYLWQGDEKYWTGRAYNLFPICGRLVENKYTYKGKTYEMKSHGFVRDSIFEVEKVSDSEIIFTLAPNEVIRAQYPFDFKYSVIYKLNGNTLDNIYYVKNDGETDMYFGVGGHPGFNVPMGGEGEFEDYYLEFDCVKPAKQLIFTPFYNTGRTEPYALEDGKIFPLRHDLFDIDGVFLTDICKKVTLKSKSGSKSVRLEYPEMPHIGVWHKPKTDAPYVCLEPWCSVPGFEGKISDIEEKEQMVRLAPNGDYQNGFKIIIK